MTDQELQNESRPDTAGPGRLLASGATVELNGRLPRVESDVSGALESEKEQHLGSSSRETGRIALAQAICGKYAFVPASSAEFVATKSSEIALEDRPR